MSNNHTLGEDIFKTLTITDEAAVVVDLSDASWEIYFGLFRNKSDTWAEAAVTKTITGGGITKTDAVNGEVEIHIDDTDTEDLTPGKYYAWVKAVNPSLYEWDVITGELFTFTYSPTKNL